MTYKEFVDYCMKKNADVIFVRYRINGKWQNVALSQLPEEIAMRFVNDWWAEGRMPYRVMES